MLAEPDAAGPRNRRVDLELLSGFLGGGFHLAIARGRALMDEEGVFRAALGAPFQVVVDEVGDGHWPLLREFLWESCRLGMSPWGIQARETRKILKQC